MMKNIRTLILSLALIGSGLNTGGALAQEILLAQDACQVAGQRLAAERGATLLAAGATTTNGAAACEIVLLVPASDGSRPKREVVVVAR